jgi:hypothetical protein
MMLPEQEPLFPTEGRDWEGARIPSQKTCQLTRRKAESLIQCFRVKSGGDKQLSSLHLFPEAVTKKF